MSQIATAPETNPTEVVNSFHQVLNVKPSVEIIDFGADDMSDMPIRNSFVMSQPDWVKLASKNKYIEKFTWNLTDTGIIWSKDWTYDTLAPLIPSGIIENSYVKFSKVLISIKPTNNAFLKGMTYISCYNGPPLYSSVTGTAVTTDNRVFYQLKHAPLSPQSSNEINFMLPINYPFEMFKTPILTVSTTNYSDKLAQYTRSYPLCSTYARVFDQLSTTSAVTSLDFTVSGQILDLELNGVRYNDPN